jgi:hypothetical protein
MAIAASVCEGRLARDEADDTDATDMSNELCPHRARAAEHTRTSNLGTSGLPSTAGRSLRTTVGE